MKACPYLVDSNQHRGAAEASWEVCSTFRETLFDDVEFQCLMIPKLARRRYGNDGNLIY